MSGDLALGLFFGWGFGWSSALAAVMLLDWLHDMREDADG